MRSANKKKYVTIAAALILVYAIALVASISIKSQKPNIDTWPKESTQEDFTKVARIYEGSTILEDIGGQNQYGAFTRDLKVYAQSNFPEYADETKIVGFIIKGKIKKSGATLSFHGEYGASADRIDVTIIKQNNTRISSSIVDSKTKHNIDEALPSNSALDTYISTLPLYNNNYSVEFDNDSQKITVYQYERNPDIATAIQDDLKKQLGDSYDQDMFLFLFPPASDSSEPTDQVFYD